MSDAVPKRSQAGKGGKPPRGRKEKKSASGDAESNLGQLGVVSGGLKPTIQGDGQEGSGNHADVRGTGGDGVYGKPDEIRSRKIHSKPSTGNRATKSDSGAISSSHSDSDATSEQLHSEEGTIDPEHIAKLRDPVYFARATCLKFLDPWQIKLLGDARTPGRTALRGANGIGKTVIIAVLILFFLSTVKNCRVVVVSGVFRQLKMMVDHLQSLLKNFPGWRVLRGSHELHSPFAENKATWFATDNPGAAQGQHSVVDAVDLDNSAIDEDGEALQRELDDAKAAGSCLVLIRDECRDIQEGVKGATDTFGATWTFDFSNPGNAIGWFYDIFALLGNITRLHHVKAHDSSYITKAYIEEMAQIHKKTSARYLNAIEAEFTDYSVQNLISLDSVNRLIANPPLHRHNGVRHAGVDPSAAKKGGDEFIIAPILGNKVEELISITGYLSPLEAVGQAINQLRRIKAKKIRVDNGGMGQLVIPIFEEQLNGDESLQIKKEDFGGSPVANNPMSKHGKCANRATELWVNLAEKIEKREIILPNDPVLVRQLVTREFETLGDGSIRLISKKTMKGKGLPSPDRADAVALAAIDILGLQPVQVFDYRMGGQEADDDGSYGTTSDGGFVL